jgi:predicted methyltransferase
MTRPVVLSHVQVKPLLDAQERGETATIASLDLGLTTIEVSLQGDRVLLPGGQWLTWETIREIEENEIACFVVEGHEAEKIQEFSKELNRFYSLMPTRQAPTLLVSGIPMHRIKDTNPTQDTLRKTRTVAPLLGQVLDTCTGLGYTAIEAAKTAEQVITIELDPTVLEIARLNPWSRPLFENPRIEQMTGDAFDVVASLEDGTFSRIIHDPPMFNLAGELYSGACYEELHRILARKGRLFHYIGNLESRSGRNVARGVVRRLQDAGFSRIVRKPGAFGLVAYR